jgi:hypothetical protein
MLKGSFTAKKHPVNSRRVRQLLDEIVAEYQPDTMMLRSTCADLASYRERVENTKPGSPEHRYAVQMSQDLFAALEASRTPRELETTTDLAHLSDDELIHKVTGMLRALLATREQRRREETTSPFDSSPLAGRSPIVDLPASVSADPPVSVTATSAPEPEPCPYCMHAPCVGPDHDAYAALHHDDPHAHRILDERLRKKTAEEFEMRRRYGLTPYSW